ncbi:WD40-repeat-containing domain protein [Truncatella angustata]|uniref:WD40-repeat-containing domain protein n=1 Tax=Truncatella angustata TaxID=152316 RepID=A0A9P8UF78_9PEZI|nr:WD40-repeat-containing domain protein [Truncatella angustata]KAH6648775.1 WD40-repeat-containing domain protein [Truncatella angustata]
MDAETGLDEDDADFEPDDDDEDAEDDGLMADIFEDGDEFHDTEEGNVEFVVEVEDAAADADAAGGDNAEDDDAPQRTIRLIGNPRIALTQRQLLAFLRGTHMGHLLFDNDDEEEGIWGQRRQRRRSRDPNRFPKVPSDKGMELMNSGTFGATGYGGSLKAKKRIARRILDREMGLGNSTARKINQGLVAQSLLPTTDAEMQINYDEPVYSGQFSDDGNFFYSCVKDFKVRMYDTSNPYNWRHYKTVAFPGGSWTLTDASLSPDNKWLAYTSIESRVCLAPTDPNDTGDPYMLNLAGDGRTRSTYGWRGGGFGIWSIRFSGDGKELVAGTNANSIVVYDIETRQVLHSIEGHGDHVNAVCFADKLSPHILYSGSDDATIKVWDRRSMGDGREAGAFVGHVEGLTYIDSKGDGRYILSNGKDQSMKLWDLKMMYTTAEFREKNPTQHTGYSNFDYRWGPYDDNDWFPHPDDNSVVTFRGHKVLRTLIRCHFSPPGSTDSRYVYSGSHDGKVWVYNMDATVAAKIDVRKASMNAHALPPRWRAHHQSRGFRGWSTVVRDASWHPNAPFIAASSLNGWDHHVGTVTVHSFNENNNDEGEPRMGSGYTDKLKPVNADHGSESSGQWEDEDEEEEEEEEEDEDDDDEDGGLGI